MARKKKEEKTIAGASHNTKENEANQRKIIKQLNYPDVKPASTTEEPKKEEK